VAALTPAHGLTANGSRSQFLVPVGAADSGFGPFHEMSGQSGHRMRALFGAPSRVEPEVDGTNYCRLTWPAIGLRADFATYGTPHPDPCTNGYFRLARLTDQRWHTASGVQVGGRREPARRAAVRRCRPNEYGCVASGYVLGLHGSECAAGKFPTVIAHPRGRTIVSLIVASRFCE
jgi:hypothetical protein